MVYTPPYIYIYQAYIHPVSECFVEVLLAWLVVITFTVHNIWTIEGEAWIRVTVHVTGML